MYKFIVTEADEKVFTVAFERTSGIYISELRCQGKV